MTTRQRKYIYEGILLFIVGVFGGGHALPSMMSATDSMTVISAGILTVLLVAWLGLYVARLAFFLKDWK